ncbi:MAG: hypothetical protein GXX82_08490 [Syntrophorhabdus sp.]|nr:hypothetical protein [Syntrophorhabdus sp.]
MENPWTEYLDQMSEAEFAELTAEGVLELKNNAMREEDEELAEEEALLGLPRGYWVPAMEYRYINESAAFLDARWDLVEAEYARRDAELEAMEKEMEALKERERKAKWKPFV